jgi:hypothetical protein
MTDGPHTGHRAERSRWWSRATVLLLVGALALRLGFIASRDPRDWLAGGDGPWYVQQGWRVAHDALPRPLSTVGPLYPTALGAVWLGFPGHPEPLEPGAIPAAYLWAVRALQALVAVLTVGMAHALSRRMVSDPRAALLTTVGVGLGPAFVIEPFMVRTETLFMGLFAAALLAYVVAQRRRGAAWTAMSGVLLGLAVLTRPILLPFPLALAALLALRHGRAGLRRAGTLLVACALTLLPWHVALYRGTGRALPEGLGANLLSGATEEGRPMERARLHEAERRAPTGLVWAAIDRIAEDPVRWIGVRSRNVLDGIVQPHGTSDLAGPSVKEAARRWLAEDRSLARAWAIAARPGFAAKAAIHAFHFGALALALLGAWGSRARWREWLPIYLAIGYLVLAYGTLIVIPRYLFPATVFLWVLAGSGFTWAWPSRDRPRG